MANMGSNYINIVTCQLIFLPKTDELMDPGIFLKINPPLFAERAKFSFRFEKKRKNALFDPKDGQKLTNSVHSMQVAIGVL